MEATNKRGNTAFSECCYWGSIESGLLLLRRGASFERHNLPGYAPLHQAAQHGHSSLVEVILDRGGNIDVLKSGIPSTPLAEACEHGRLEVVRTLLARGAATKIPIGEDRQTALMRAAVRGHTTVVKSMLDSDRAVSVEALNARGETALFLAVLYGRTETVRLLLQRGANIEVRDQEQNTLLICSCWNTQIEIDELLVRAGANIHASNQNGNTPLHELSTRGNVTTARLLLEHGADPACLESEDHTPLNFAAGQGHSAFVRLLLESGCIAIDHVNQLGWTSLQEASWHGHLEIVQDLLDYGADANICDNKKNSPLNRACCMGHLAIAVLLMDEGNADINMRNEHGLTPLAEASYRNEAKVVKALLDRDARKDICDNHGRSPWTLARLGGHKYVMSLLD